MKLIVFMLWVITTSATAGVPEHVKQEADLRVKHHINPSIALAVYQQGQADYHVTGWQNLDKKTPVTIDSVYEIGSISKTFTGLLLAVLKEQGQLTLDDPVEKFWAGQMSLKDVSGQAVTLKHLSTHTSGLSRLPANLSIFSDDPYADYGVDKLLQAVNKSAPETAGKNFEYSNFAVGLLGETLAKSAGNSYNSLIEKLVLEPLNLQQTYMLHQQVPKEHLVTGYNMFAETYAWNFKALAAAGSIRSSIKDLLNYGVAYLNPPNELYRKAMSLAFTTHYQSGQLQIGLGWFKRGDIMWHNGGTGGFRSIIMIDPKQQKVVAGITNHANQDIEDMVAHLMDASKPMKKHDFPVPITPEEMQPFEGHYEHPSSGQTIDITIKGDLLYFSASSKIEQDLQFIGEHTFKLKVIGAKVKFNQSENGKVDSLDLTAWGEPQTYLRID